jgi:hypothetical protein
MDRLFLDANTVLCTLSMLSNPALDTRGVFKLVPMQMLVIDEASQINVFEYMVRGFLWRVFIPLETQRLAAPSREV